MTKQFITSSVTLSQTQRDLLARLRDLRLNGMALALATQWETMSIYSGMSFDERLRALLSEQENFANTARAEYLLKRSNIPGHLELNSILASDDRNFKESLKAELATLNFVNQINNIIIMGQTSSGKSALACALGRLCCRRGLAAKYYRANDLLSELENSSYEKRMKTRNGLKRIKLLILDDLGLHPISETQCHMLFDVLDDRVNVGPVIISTQATERGLAKAMSASKHTIDANMRRILQGSIQIRLQGDINAMLGGVPLIEPAEQNNQEAISEVKA